MNKFKVAGILLVAAGVLLPVLSYDIPSPVDTMLTLDQTATSTSYLLFPFINWLTLIGLGVVAVGIYLDWKAAKKK